jgi:Tol biopolymer transport system component
MDDHRIGRGLAAQGPRRLAMALGSLVLVAVLFPGQGSAQYFGRNKVQYDRFDFRVLHTPHFDLHHYPPAEEPAADAARMAERWYGRIASVFGHDLTGKTPIILYADHPDFQQTNVISGMIGEGTGGVTESLRERVILPLTGVYRENDHVLGHELVHAFQYDLATSPHGGGFEGLGRLPLWVIEGLAEYLSVGRDDPHTAMWLRDAVLRGDMPTIEQLTRDPRYFPYRFGHALWAYIGGRWSDSTAGALFRTAAREGWEPALAKVLGTNSAELSREWHAAIREAYFHAMQGRSAPAEAGERLIPVREPGEMNLSPVLSPDGRHVAFFSERGLFTVEIWVADAQTGKVLRKLAGPNTDTHFDAISFINSAGTWSPDGRKFAFVAIAEGDHQLALLDVASGDVERIPVPGVGAISGPAWSPDGRSIAFSGMAGGVSDLYVLDVEGGAVRQLTRDRYADLQPAWSPDGRTLVFVTDRGPATDFERLAYGPPRLARIARGGGEVELLTVFEGAKHLSPQFSPDGASLYFVSDREGFSDIYRLDLGSREVFQVTRLATGVSGITALAPALSVASRTGRLAFSVFESRGYAIYALDPDPALGERVPRGDLKAAVAGALPPANAETQVGAYLADPFAWLPAPQLYEVTDYRPSLGLDYIGAPTVGVGTGSLGTYLGGSAALYFGDMLGNRTLGVSAFAAGTPKDLGGEIFYVNRSRRWNWLVGGGRVPYLTGFTTLETGIVDVDGQPVLGRRISQYRERTYYDQALAGTQYPFSTTRRFELTGGYVHIGFDREVEETVIVGGREVARETRDLPAPEGVHLAQVSAALVGDDSYFGFTSPVSGGRYRLEVSPRIGTLNYQTLLADWRRYFFRAPVTLALRGLHYGRYGKDADSDRLTPLFLGEQTLVRGYSFGSFEAGECSGTSTCPEFDRLIGSRVAVANLELRVPLFGTSQFGLIDFPALPTELSVFLDAGAAWTGDQGVELDLARRSAERTPVLSTGISARVNLLGYLVLEAYYAYPFQRPDKGWHWGFQIAPGW